MQEQNNQICHWAMLQNILIACIEREPNMCLEILSNSSKSRSKATGREGVHARSC